MHDNEHSIHPFDLQVPARLLYPRYSPIGEHAEITKLELGGGDYTATLVRTHYRDGETRWHVEIECDYTPHCDTCECTAQHSARILPEQVVQLRQFLGL